VAAHSKHIARVVAKGWLEGLRESGISHLNAAGLMECSTQNQLHEKVLPWLFAKIDNFMAQDDEVNQNAHEMIETGIRKQQKVHEKSIYDHAKAVNAAETRAKEEEVKRQHRKQERRHIRQLRVKEEIKTVLKNEILKVVYDKGDVRSPAANFELMDLHQNFNNEKNVLTTIGGHFQ
jgi:hypothetical protein